MTPSPLDPVLLEALAQSARAGRRPLAELTPQAARAQLRARAAAAAPGPPVETVRPIEIPAAHLPVPARLYEPAQVRSTVVYVHGGGWSVGDLDGYDALCRKIAVRSDSRVVSVAYRLAPEHPFPAGLTDVEAAVRWAAERYPEAPLVLAGDSAGANLATVCARRAREHGGPRIAAQLLISPVTDHDPTRPSYGRNTDELLLLRAADMAWFWDLYVPDARLRDDPDVSPLRAGDLSSSPPALIVLAGRDPLYDEGLAYAEALRRAGVPVDLVVHPTMAHGFVAFPSLPQAAETLDALAAAVRGAQRRHQTDPKTDPTEVPR